MLCFCIEVGANALLLLFGELKTNFVWVEIVFSCVYQNTLICSPAFAQRGCVLSTSLCYIRYEGKGVDVASIALNLNSQNKKSLKPLVHVNTVAIVMMSLEQVCALLVSGSRG